MSEAPTAESLAASAKVVEDNIVAGVGQIRTTFVHLAGYLHEFLEGRMWEPLGYEKLEEWLAGPEIELKRTQTLRLVRVYRTFVLERQVPLRELEGVSARKLDEAIPALKRGDVSAEEAISDARSLALHDMTMRYRGDLNAPIDPESEPARVQCPTCGQWADAEKVGT